jgi:hypothetical protein
MSKSFPWEEPGEAALKPVAPLRRHPVAGTACLVGAVLALYYLLVHGGVILLAGTAGRAISGLSPPDEVRADGMEEMMALGAAMLLAGACLGPGLALGGVKFFQGRSRAAFGTLSLAVGLAIVLGGGAAGALLKLTEKPAMSPALRGLEGVWRDGGSWAYCFNSDGTVDGWSTGLGGGKVGTWSRSGQVVTFRSDRGWQVVGTLKGSQIRGTMSTAPGGTYASPVVWKRKVVP